MADASGGAPGNLVDKLVLKSGSVTPEQLADAKQLVAKMAALGVERDVFGALVDRKVVSAAHAEEMRAFVQSAAKAAPAKPAADEVRLTIAEPDANDPGSGEIMLKTATPLPTLAPAGTAQGAAASNAVGASCGFHPGVPAVNQCNHCNRPVCKDCVIRTEKGYYCSQECMDGARNARSAADGFRIGKFNKAVNLGRTLSWVGAVIVIAIIGWVIKYVVDDYRFSSAMRRGGDARDNAKLAIEEYSRAVGLKPEDVLARVKLGEALLGAKEVGTAITTLEKAVELDARNVDALKMLSEAYYRKGSFRDARETLLALRETDKIDSAGEKRLGTICQDELERYEDAVEAYENSIAIGSESRELRYRIGKALTSMGKFAEAYKELSRAVAPVKKAASANASIERAFLSNKKRVSEVHLALADLALKQDNLNAALESVGTAHQMNPDSFAVVKLRVELLIKANRKDDALPAALHSRGELGKNPDYLDLLSGLQLAAGQGDSYVRTLRNLAAADPGRKSLQEKLIHAEALYGNTEKAKELLGGLEPSVSHSAKFADDWAEIIQRTLTRGRPAEAERMLRKLGSLADTDPRFAAAWCESLHAQGRVDEALERAEAALKSDRTAPTPHLIVGSVLRSLGRTKEALESVRKASRLGAGGAADYEAAIILWNAGMKDEAAKLLNVALKDRSLSKRARANIKLAVSRMRGPRLEVERTSSVEDYIFTAVNITDRQAGNLLWQIHLASFGIARSFSVISGATGLDPVGDELTKLKEVGYNEEDLEGHEAFDAIRVQYDRAVKTSSAAYRTMLSRSSAGALDVPLREYGRATSGAVSIFGQMAAAAEAQAKLMAVWLAHHPRHQVLAIQVKIILARMKTRTASSPGELQRAIAADCALAEMTRAAIAHGRNQAAYAAASDAAMAHMAGRLASSTDPLEQLGASRSGAFKLVWILSRQVLEQGHASTEGEERGSGRVAAAVEGGAR